VNRVILLKQFILAVLPIFESLAGARSELLTRIQSFCAPVSIQPVKELIDDVVNEDVTFATTPLGFRSQRNYAIKA
jgi:DNA mismatch repair protein MSH4